MLRLSHLRFRIGFMEKARLPRWLGSAFRGGFGRNFRKAICIKEDCNSCSETETCLYYYMYERKKMRRGYAPPVRPLIIIPPFFGKPMNLKKDGYLDLDVLFFGDFKKYIPHFILGLKLLGERGISKNRFEILNGTCGFSHDLVYDGNTIYASNIMEKDVSDMDKEINKRIEIGFRTPLILKKEDFPPKPEKLIGMIRRRLILFVNEYGSGEEIPDFKCEGEVIAKDKHYHRLIGVSTRQGQRIFENAFTGIAEYRFKELDENAKWLLNVGREIGLGPKSSFGCGFFEIRG